MTATLLATLSCAKEKTPGINDDAKAYFDAWISQNHPTATKTPLGAYILSETPGTGAAAGNSAYVRVNYTTYTLKGALSSTTLEKKARQAGTYNKSAYYGPVVAYRGEEQENLSAGVEEAFSTMRIGGRKTVVIPGWLNDSDRYDTPEEYLENCSGTDYVYEFELVDAFDDVDSWERDSLLKYMSVNYPGATEDEDLPGFFYVRTKAGSEKEFTADTTIYINYTGRLLNGKVFDTTVKDTAKVWGLYSASSEYKQIKINWYASGEDYNGITMGDNESETVTGFAYALSKMHPGEAGVCFFTSKYGYKGSGSGSTIPSYSPLCFELETTVAP